MAEEDYLEMKSERFIQRLSNWKPIFRGESLWEHAVGIVPEFSSSLFKLPEATFIPEDWNVKYPFFMAMNRFLVSLGWGKPIPDWDPEFAPVGVAAPNERPYMHPVELRIEFPRAPEIAREQWEEAIWHLADCGQISFELVAAESRVVCQFVCDESLRLKARNILEHFLPGVLIQEFRSHLIDHFYAKTKESAAMVQEFGLVKDFLIPLKTWQPHEDDPLNAIVDVLCGMESDECAFFQVTFSRVDKAWQQSFETLCRSNSPVELSQVFEDAADLGRIQRKLSRRWLAVVVRIGFRTNNLEKAKLNFKALEASFKLEEFGGNRLKAIPNHNDFTVYGIQEHIEHAVMRQHRRTGMLLSFDELLSLVHLPLARAGHPQVNLVPQRTKAPRLQPIPQNEDFGGFLGVNRHKAELENVLLTEEQRSRHTYVIGVSGTGKSTLLFTLILRDMIAGRGCAVIDPHGDLIEKLLEYVPEERLNDVVVIDPADEKFPVGFNILSANSDAERNLLASDLVAVFRRLSTAWGDQMNSVLANAILAFLENPKGGTLVDLRNFLVDKEFRLKYLDGVKDESLRYYWAKEFPMLSGKPQGPILTRLDAFLRPKIIRNMVSQRHTLDIPGILSEKRIVFAKLTHGAIGEENAYLLGSLLVSRIYQAALGRQSLPQSERSLFNLYIDEFHNFVTPSIASILSGGRKYGLGLTLAHQELRQLWSRDEQVASAVLANPATRVCFRVGEWDAQKLAEGFSFFNAKDIQGLKKGEAICRVDTADNDFNLTTIPYDLLVPGSGPEWRDFVVERSRGCYASEIEEPESPAESPEEIVEESPRLVPKVESIAPPVPNVTTPKISRPKETEARSVEPAPEISEEIETVLPATQPGKGGKQHKYLQSLIQKLAEEKGWLAEIEKAVLDGAGSIDVSLERSGRKIACEVSVTTGADHELGNAQKCLASGYELVALVSPYPKTIGRLRKLLNELEEEARKRTRLFSVEEFILFLEEQEPGESTTETIINGRKVKANFNAQSPEQIEARKKSIALTILAAMKRMKGK